MTRANSVLAFCRVEFMPVDRQSACWPLIAKVENLERVADVPP